jgi:hypothetical protein
MGGYTPSGPWNNGGSPPISAAFLGNVENWIQQTEGSTGSIVLSGSTSGTATLYQVLQGPFKLVIVQLNNFRNGSAPAQTLAMPTPFTATCRGWNSNVNPFQLLKASVAQTVQQLTALNNGADNGVAPQTTLRANWLWHCDTFIDTISFNGSQGVAVGGQIVMFGV